jgi:hypothetical protein
MGRYYSMTMLSRCQTIANDDVACLADGAHSWIVVEHDRGVSVEATSCTWLMRDEESLAVVMLMLMMH